MDSRSTKKINYIFSAELETKFLTSLEPGTHLLTVPVGCSFQDGNITIIQDGKIEEELMTIVYDIKVKMPSVMQFSETSIILKEIKLDDLK